MVIHFHNILLGKPACFAPEPEVRGALTVVPEDVTCPGCVSYLRGDRCSWESGDAARGGAPSRS